MNGASTLVLPGTTAAIAFGNGRSNDGFVGGGQIGYNYQFTPGSGVVVGIEADAQYVDFGRERNRFSATGPLAAQQVFNPAGVSGLDYFGTVRGRLGYAFDRTLVYVGPRLLRHRPRSPRLRLRPHPRVRHRRLRLRFGWRSRLRSDQFQP
ncbi:hypothetical protein ASG63_22255 [Methylobacterium sp. Leaf94]|nr:hypothetical protein ASG63_22255 [Methylobacterium sp. Leaf94]